MVEQHRAADHHGGEDLFVDVAGIFKPGQTPLTHHADAVGDGHDLIELVGDDDDGHLLFADDAADDVEQLVRLLRGEDGGRLVEDEDVRAAVERFQYLDALLKPDADIPHGGGGVDLKAVFLHKAARFAFGLGVVEEHAEPARLAAEDDVLRDGERRDEHEVLVHHADAALDGRLRAEVLDALAFDVDLAVGGRVDAVEDVHKRGFARAVFADEREHLALFYFKRHVVVCEHAGEFHRDVLKFYNRF